MAEALSRLEKNIASVIKGKDEVIRLAIVAFLAEGHLLLEDIPGVGKTTLAKALAKSLDVSFNRIQFTPDLLPSDVTGASIFNQASREFEFHRGPVFSNILLADEINRATPRTQSSLLEAMNEYQVTVDNGTYALQRPFFVIATQNPIEFQGTFPLPEAQLDRFLMRLSIGYPSSEQELDILRTRQGFDPVDSVEPVAEGEIALKLIRQARETHVSEEVMGYIVALAHATRSHPKVRLGVSPRGTLSLMRAAQAHAVLQDHDFVSPDDVKVVAEATLSHRVILSHQHGPDEGPEQLVRQLLDTVPVPR